MHRKETLLWGLVKKECWVFLDKRIDNIEIVETTTLFGRWVIREEVREVFVPDIEVTDTLEIRVFGDAYRELHEFIRRLRELDKV